jgi:hypothetical protein
MRCHTVLITFKHHPAILPNPQHCKIISEHASFTACICCIIYQQLITQYKPHVAPNKPCFFTIQIRGNKNAEARLVVAGCLSVGTLEYQQGEILVGFFL